MPILIGNNEAVRLALELTQTELIEKPEAFRAEVATLPARIALITPVIASAATKLDEMNAWPDPTFSSYHIELAFGDKIETKWGPKKSSGKMKGNRSITINPDDPLRIAIGVDLLSSPLVLGLKNQTNASLTDVCVLLLCHETFHLTEADNMSRCGVPYGQTKSGFACAAHPTFSDPWRLAMLALAEGFPAYRDPTNPHAKRNTLTIWKAGDIASEACADMFALQFMKPPQIYQSTQAAWMQALIGVRQAQEANGTATPVDGNNQAANPDYQIGAVLANLAPQLIGKDQWDIREAMWREAFTVALTDAIYLTTETRDVINAALIAPAKAPPTPKPTSLWDKAISKLKK